MGFWWQQNIKQIPPDHDSYIFFNLFLFYFFYLFFYNCAVFLWNEDAINSSWQRISFPQTLRKHWEYRASYMRWCRANQIRSVVYYPDARISSINEKYETLIRCEKPSWHKRRSFCTRDWTTWTSTASTGSSTGSLIISVTSNSAGAGMSGEVFFFFFAL